MTDESRALHRRNSHGSTSTGSGSSSRQELCPRGQGHGWVGPCKTPRPRAAHCSPPQGAQNQLPQLPSIQLTCKILHFCYFLLQILLAGLCQTQLLVIHAAPAPPGTSPEHLCEEWGCTPRKILPFTSFSSLSKAWNFTSLCNSMSPTPKDQLLLLPTQGHKRVPGLLPFNSYI